MCVWHEGVDTDVFVAAAEDGEEKAAGLGPRNSPFAPVNPSLGKDIKIDRSCISTVCEDMVFRKRTPSLMSISFCT